MRGEGAAAVAGVALAVLLWCSSTAHANPHLVPTPRHELYFQLLREAMQTARLDGQTPVPVAAGTVDQMRMRVVDGFLTHNYTRRDAEEVIAYARHLTYPELLLPLRHTKHLEPEHQVHSATRFAKFLPPSLHDVAAVSSLPTFSMRRTVWLLWFDGWESAPWLVLEVAKSWERHNVGWEVARLDRQSLKLYMDVEWLFDPANKIALPAASDVIRLNLLAMFGGVWADATMLCMAPLDSYIWGLLRPVGLWMYHGAADCKAPASWFIVASNSSYIVQQWAHRTYRFWYHRLQHGNLTSDYNYFWMDRVFHQLQLKDPTFEEQWQRVPYLCCELTQSHMLAGRVSEDDPTRKELLASHPPWAVKLTRHGLPATIKEARHTNGYFAIMQSYRQRPGLEHPVAWDGWPA